MVGKVAEGGPAGLSKESRITKPYLVELPTDKWFEIRLRNEEANLQLEKAREHLKIQRKLLDERYEEKKIKTHLRG